ncbi:uncharacterized protein CANTADRAFT_33187, partial [Suhomyces tanzawaensis NRRL Y-17324]
SNSKKKKRKYTSPAVPKCRHLKKSDGEPFWRKDIQYDFLQELFDDPTPAFTNEFPFCDIPSANNSPKLTFSELYIRSLVESSKCSKILKERLIKDVDLGKSVSKVCLLVNAGRMNTTINFVPEMRSTLRTYHSIPSLQADPQYGGSKPLQDTPRLKSILKAVCEGDDVVKSLEELLAHPPVKKPNTNVIQIIFLLSNYNKNIPHFDDESVDMSSRLFNSFMQFFLNSKMHPKCRARRFLWLLYTYLETNFSPEELASNPFGGAVPPSVDYIPDEELESFDKDTDFEIEYSEQMYKTRLQYLADEEHNSTPKRGNKSKSDLAAAAAAAAAAENGSESHDNEEYRQLLTDDAKSKKKKSRRSSGKAGPSPLTRTVIFAGPKHDDYSSEDSDSSVDYLEENYSAIDFSPKNPIRNRSKVRKLEFPIENLDVLNELYSTSSYISEVPQESTAIIARQDVVDRSKPIIYQVRTSSKASTASFNKKTIILGNWVYRYFKYKKSIGNKLLGIEWEDIRYDLINGLESYMYQQFGRSLDLRHVPEAHQHPKESSEEDLAFEYLPAHEFNAINETNSYLLQLATYCNDWFLKRISQEKFDRPALILFDLENNTMN